MSENKTAMTLEENFDAIEKILKALESRDTSLEDSFSLYQKGMEMIRDCNKKIDTIEKKMKIMNEEGEQFDFQ